MRSLDILAHFRSQFRKEFCNYIIRGQPVRILCSEIFFANNAARVDEIEPRECHAGGHALGLGVEDIKTANGPGIRISQQRKVDFVPAGEVLQDSRAIVANGGQLDALLFKSSFRVLQLHELRFAEGSPICGTEEEKNRSIRASQCLVRLRMIKLIKKRKGRRIASDFQSDGRRNSWLVR